MVDDPYLWLEDVTGDDALDWVRKHNDATVAELGGERFERTRAELLEILDTDERIPYVGIRGAYLYNFWRDEANPRGLWRRTTRESYRSDNPDWEVVIDVDQLARDEDENWVWAGPTVIEPEHTLAMISLSRGGADATVVREFDMRTKQFVEGGFELPEAKSSVSWEDEDTLLVCTDFGEGSMTESGYPRIAKRWRRGEPLENAETVFTAEPTDVQVAATVDRTPGYEHTRFARATDFYNLLRYEARGDELIYIDVPTDATTSTHHEWLLISPRSDWQVGDVTYPAGSLIATNFDDFLSGSRDLTVVYEPDEHSCLYSIDWTKDKLILVTRRDVASHVEIVTPGTWERRDAPDIPASDETVVAAVDPYGDEVFYDSSGFTTPSRLLYGTAGGALQQVKSAPSFFDAEGITVTQNFATSKDGTAIPYFVVGQKDEPAPTYLYGYGGFQSSMTPGYAGGIGREWLTRGGTYVLANIRGGGEYGPRWHTQAMRENRHLVYEDFAAVAADLVRRGITTVEQLAAAGGSNGGLLMGVMLTQYPELFGALVCSVPLLDMKRYHLLLAGASWMAEYGDPDVPEDWEFISKYSPYQNISPDRRYPPILITTSTRDDRVHPGHARKMTAALEEAGHRVYYYENIEGGHGGAADNAQAAFKGALTYEFLWRMLAG
ncbi:prolyl oligopeptidase [Mycolicibacterium mageritense DSM 44476 = CIP 104973]|uniref:Prolyl oligopeptidase n=1 Tax=Mycolicibacterium mageritense TaxID=53462 RepID=A0ABM7HV91_MYCME|nr:prolyl oligopeptidase family serine peptidase [Mycolicibacterium mageritense]MCC9180707.1 prolyl oligopeptidase family serine peptidase [Mycolicibacterium mageritense]BBX34504.1 prolyl oligopeptidase [Mycolicibacterium mageritense]GJJ23825.1 prolyl oligopeptidase [Mycolicibacterium mageritense]CDO20977.1 prolyl oligopeptidase [Mycolicibacterium mageritense DSM 44476 = CIP 104973]